MLDGREIMGTGCYDGNHITGVYVLPHYQKRGCGSQIMDCLEAEIVKKYDTAILDASLPAACLYEHRGYKTVGHGIYELENEVKLVYEIMEKKVDIGKCSVLFNEFCKKICYTIFRHAKDYELSKR